MDNQRKPNNERRVSQLEVQGNYERMMHRFRFLKHDLEQLNRVPELAKKFGLDDLERRLEALDVLVYPLGYFDTH